MLLKVTQSRSILSVCGAFCPFPLSTARDTRRLEDRMYFLVTVPIKPCPLYIVTGARLPGVGDYHYSRPDLLCN